MSTRAQSLVPHARSRVAPSVFAKSTLCVAHGVAVSTRSTLAFARVVVRRRASACARAHVVVVVVKANMIRQPRSADALSARRATRAIRAAAAASRRSRAFEHPRTGCAKKNERRARARGKKIRRRPPRNPVIVRASTRAPNSVVAPRARRAVSLRRSSPRNMAAEQHERAFQKQLGVNVGCVR